MYNTKITSDQAREFTLKYADCMEAVRGAFLHEFSSREYRGSFDDYICQLEGDMNRRVNRLETANAIELAENNAHQMPRVYVQYKIDQRSGATRLKFDDYLPYIKKEQGGRSRVALV